MGQTDWMVMPSGTVTLLFSDVEASTQLWERFSSAMSEALRRHDEIVRSAIEGEDGYVFKTVGDSFCAVFATGNAAARAASAIQQSVRTEKWPPDAVIRVRLALHSGVCEERDGD
jgi:class 3 adenylate cyclase